MAKGTGPRTEEGGPAEIAIRIAKARDEFLASAEDDFAKARYTSAVSNAVLAGINAGDGICLLHAGRRSASPSHADAVGLLAESGEDGAEQALSAAAEMVSAVERVARADPRWPAIDEELAHLHNVKEMGQAEAEGLRALQRARASGRLDPPDPPDSGSGIRDRGHDKSGTPVTEHTRRAPKRR